MVYRRLSDRKAEQARAALQRNWITLVEAIEFIKRVDSESSIKTQQTAFEQICDAIEEGELGARWLDPAQPPRDGSSALWTPDEPCYFVPELRKRKVRPDNGGEIHWGGCRWRKLLLSRKGMSIFEQSVPKDIPADKSIRQLAWNPSGIKLINEAISAVFASAKEQNVKPPNVREMRKLANEWLKKYRDATAREQWIEKTAGEEQYKSLRGKPGATNKGRLRPISELKI